MKKIFRVIMLILMIALLAYLGTCAYANLIAKPENEGNTSIPDKDDAAYSLVVKNTATVLLTNNYEQFGDQVGNRTFVLHGYWELIGSDFSFIGRDIILQEAVWGEIILKKR